MSETESGSLSVEQDREISADAEQPAARASSARLRLPHPWWDVRRASGRLMAALLVGIGAGVATPARLGWRLRALVGWDVGSFLLCGILLWIIYATGPWETKRRACSEDPGRQAVRFIALISSVFALFAAATVLRDARTWPGIAGTVWVALALLAVVLAWVLTHAVYTLRYAHLYHRNGQSAGGLEFPGKHVPADIDFAYFAFTIGMCFQVSDVVISSRAVRKAALGHALLSFVYNTTILALALNLAFALASPN